MKLAVGVTFASIAMVIFRYNTLELDSSIWWLWLGLNMVVSGIAGACWVLAFQERRRRKELKWRQLDNH